MLLWREVLSNIFQLWQFAEDDFIDGEHYRLHNTGQGLNRVQQVWLHSAWFHACGELCRVCSFARVNVCSVMCVCLLQRKLRPGSQACTSHVTDSAKSKA